jgi:hypothetical protein
MDAPDAESAPLLWTALCGVRGGYLQRSNGVSRGATTKIIAPIAEMLYNFIMIDETATKAEIHQNGPHNYNRRMPCHRVPNQ